MLDKLHSKYFSGYEFSAPVIIDVGVMEGTPFLYKSFPKAKFVLIDALAESEAAVAARWSTKIDYDFHVTALGAAPSEISMEVLTAGLARSTVNARLDGHAGAGVMRTVPVTPLDDITKAYKGPFGLKIDTEGHELEVLKGAVETLKTCEFVITETSIKNRFAGGYRFSEVIAFMAANGFEVYSFLTGHTRAPRFSDVLFIPADSPRFNLSSKDDPAA
jgi:FkbM family methyltransferase